MSPRITIHGSYGTGNRGDNGILIQLLRFLAEQRPGSRVTVLCRDEQRLAALFARELPGIDLRLQPLHSSLRQHPLKVLRACLGCDLFILGGGGLLWGKAPGNLSYWLRGPRLALAAGRRLAFYAPGIYGLEGTRAPRLLERVARRAHFLSVRDDEGLETLRELGLPEESIVRGADPAFLLGPPDRKRIEALLAERGLEGRRLVGVSARDWKSRLSAGLFSRFAQEVLADPEAVLLFFSLKTGGRPSDTDRDDLEVGRRLSLTLSEEQRRRVLLIGEDDTLEDIIALMGACDYLLGMRLHALIFCTLAGTPFAALPYDRKVAAYMEMLGRSERLIRPELLTDPEALSGMVRQLAAERAGHPGGPSPDIVALGEQMAAKARSLHEAFAAKLDQWFPRQAGR